MFKLFPGLHTRPQLEALRQLAARSQFQDGRGSNPNSSVENNQQLYDKGAADGMARALYASEEFVATFLQIGDKRDRGAGRARHGSRQLRPAPARPAQPAPPLGRHAVRIAC